MFDVYADFQPMFRQLNKLDMKLNNPQEYLESAGDYLVGRAEEGFKKQVDPYSKPWVPLSPATISEKQRQGYPLDILTRTKKMRNGVRAIVSGKSVRIIIDFPGELHQTGTRRMPQRQVLPEGDRLSKKDERNLKDMAINFLEI